MSENKNVTVLELCGSIDRHSLISRSGEPIRWRLSGSQEGETVSSECVTSGAPLQAVFTGLIRSFVHQTGVELVNLPVMEFASAQKDYPKKEKMEIPLPDNKDQVEIVAGKIALIYGSLDRDWEFLLGYLGKGHWGWWRYISFIRKIYCDKLKMTAKEEKSFRDELVKLLEFAERAERIYIPYGSLSFGPLSFRAEIADLYNPKEMPRGGKV